MLRNWVLIVAAVVALALAGVLLFRVEAPESACVEQVFEASRFTVCAFRSAEHETKLAWDDGQGRALRSFDALAASGAVDPGRVRFAMNAGMFDAAGAPIGLFVAKAQERHPINRQSGTGNFYMQPNGVFFVDERNHNYLLPTPDFVSSGLLPMWATQSGPMLVIDGALNPSFDRDGPSKNIRNGVGLRSLALSYFVISEDPVSFGEFARFFRDVLKCENALYLDGAVSSLWLPAARRRDDSYALGPMVVVSDKVRRPE
ncbi:MAG: phosphodiester glycosidase family protein [Alphaproteobacteria bacterium]|nr:phosphodiester glycosidase family protein [Alphaproteobacteria bacterium]